MKISNKIMFAFIAMNMLAVILTASFLTLSANSSSKNVLEHQIENQLISSREIKKIEIERYFNGIEKQIVNLANSTMTEDALSLFSPAFNSINQENRATEEQNTRLQNYYKNEFGQTFFDTNEKESEALDKLKNISLNGQLLQNAYIGDNENPLGNKHLLDKASDGSIYSGIHDTFHSKYREFLNAFGYYDIFLVDLSGNVIYSVFKELDFATNLIYGPYKDSGLADVFNGAKMLNQGESFFADFNSYYPSYNSPASFIATPVIKDQKTIGVLVFQMPIDSINAIMTYEGKWKEYGLGDSAESFLVGPDNLMRSQSRMLLENKEAYQESLRQSGIDKSIINRIILTESSTGQHPINTAHVNQALKGESGFKSVINHANTPVFSAYTPLNIFGKNWALVSEIEKSEAMIYQIALKEELYSLAFSIGAIMLALCSVIGFIIAKGISGPISNLTENINKITVNRDLTYRLKSKGNNEIATLSSSMNSMLDDFLDAIKAVDSQVQTLGGASKNIQVNINTMQNEVKQQADNSTQVASAATQMSASISEVASFANNASESSESVLSSVKESSSVGQLLLKEITDLSSVMEEATKSMEQLSGESKSIGSVLDEIQGIAEQTNLLALNAAIEAARAGDQGRGFSVVADEVRNLAIRTQTSTKEIRSKVESLQNETLKAVKEINGANHFLSSSVGHCDKNNEMLDKIASMMSDIYEMNSKIAQAANEQSSVTSEITLNVKNIAESARSVSSDTQNTDEIAKNINTQTQGLIKQIDMFKIA